VRAPPFATGSAWGGKSLDHFPVRYRHFREDFARRDITVPFVEGRRGLARVEDNFPISSLCRQLFSKGDDLCADAPPLAVEINGHLAKLDDRTLRPIDGGQDHAADKLAIQICGDMNVRLFFRQLLRGEIQSERRSQNTTAKLHQVAIPAGIRINLSKLQHVDTLLNIDGLFGPKADPSETRLARVRARKPDVSDADAAVASSQRVEPFVERDWRLVDARGRSAQ
jgi:hypothetical protein